MAEVLVAFRRIPGAGLKSSHIYINNKILNFQNNLGAVTLPLGEEFEVYWRIEGNPGSTLSIKYKVEEVEKSVVENSKIPSNRSRKSDFRFILL